jgi:hypothetical protein
MWADVKRDLELLLVAKIYRVLLHDAVYRHFLTLAGLGPNFSSDQIPPNLRKNFATAAKIRAHIIVAQIADEDALEEDSCGAKLVTGDARFYRFWDSGHEERRVAPWWFEAGVVETCKQHAGRSAEARRQWLREHLAVSLDWSKMNRIDVMILRPGDEVPALVGIGSPQRMWSPKALCAGQAPRADYWENYRKYFPGGVRQTVFPFIPRATGEDLNQFLSRA